MEKLWYAVYTRPRWEKKVAERLSEKKITNYCPLNRVLRKWHDRKKLVYEPLFNMYVFVQIVPQEIISVKETDGVLHFVKHNGKPAIIKNEEIDAIRQFLSDHINVMVENVEVTLDDIVRISDGPFMHMEGRVVEVGKHTVKVNLPSLKMVLYAEIDKTKITKLK